jgi:hypothetical protein
MTQAEGKEKRKIFEIRSRQGILENSDISGGGETGRRTTLRW